MFYTLEAGAIGAPSVPHYLRRSSRCAQSSVNLSPITRILTVKNRRKHEHPQMFSHGPSVMVPIMQSPARPILIRKPIGGGAAHIEHRQRKACELPFKEPRAKGAFVRT